VPTNYVKLKYFCKYYILIPSRIVRFYSIYVRFRTNKEDELAAEELAADYDDYFSFSRSNGFFLASLLPAEW
jgi:hypothetical protein